MAHLDERAGFEGDLPLIAAMEPLQTIQSILYLLQSFLSFESDFHSLQLATIGAVDRPTKKLSSAVTDALQGKRLSDFGQLSIDHQCKLWLQPLHALESSYSTTYLPLEEIDNVWQVKQQIKQRDLRHYCTKTEKAIAELDDSRQSPLQRLNS